MSRGVVYLLKGGGYLVRFLVSIYSLRKVFDGPIHVLLLSPIHPALAFLVKDKNLDISVQQLSSLPYKRFAHYILKPSIYKYSPFQQTLFLDADTLVCKDISDLWPLEDEFVLTAFSNWVTTGRIISSRIVRWTKHFPEYVKVILSSPYKAINTGVFAFDRKTEILPIWSQWVEKRPEIICDETLMQVLYIFFKHRLLSESYNCSSRFGLDSHPIIWHGHGSKHLRFGMKVPWMETYKELVALNIAEINSWTPAGDSSLRTLLEAKSDV
jgi:hypothetical protein